MSLAVTVKIIKEGPIEQTLQPSEAYRLALFQGIRKCASPMADLVNLTRLIMEFGATDGYMRICTVGVIMETTFRYEYDRDRGDYFPYREDWTCEVRCTFRMYSRIGPIRDSFGMALDKTVLSMERETRVHRGYIECIMEVHVSCGYIQRRSKPAVMLQIIDESRGWGSGCSIHRLWFFMQKGKFHRYLYPAIREYDNSQDDWVEDKEKRCFLRGKPIPADVLKEWGQRLRELKCRRHRELRCNCHK